MGMLYETGKNKWKHDHPIYENGQAVRWLLGPCPECGSVTSTYGGGYSCHNNSCINSATNFAVTAGQKPDWWNDGINVKLDGNAWCATREGFVNLQESSAGFGVTPRDAVNGLRSIENARLM